MPQSDPSKTETATKKRRDKARDKGNVPKGQELSKTVVILVGLVALYFYVGYLGRDLKGVYAYFFKMSFVLELSKKELVDIAMLCAAAMARMLLPLFFLFALAAYISLRTQVGPLWTTQVFQPKFSKFLNPLNGLKRMFVSLNTVVRLSKSILQAVAIGVAPYLVLTGEMNNLLPLFYATPTGLAKYMLETGAMMVAYAMIPMIVIAIADTWYTRWDYEENLKMTKDEVKDERKQAEGDPKVKAEQKRKMMEVVMRRMMQDVPKADVVITNPTHLAIALKYDAMEAPAPLVLAKGADRIAERIKEIARENNVPIRENKPLAQALYKNCEVGDIIPSELYQAVASILAQLQKFKRNTAPA